MMDNQIKVIGAASRTPDSAPFKALREYALPAPRSSTAKLAGNNFQANPSSS
jgi:hypothetical protein